MLVIIKVAQDSRDRPIYRLADIIGRYRYRYIGIGKLNIGIGHIGIGIGQIDIGYIGIG